MRAKYPEKPGYLRQTQLFCRGWCLNDIKQFLTRNTCHIIHTPMMTYYKVEDVERVMANNHEYFAKMQSTKKISTSKRTISKSKHNMKSFIRDIKRCTYTKNMPHMDKAYLIAKGLIIEDTSLREIVYQAISYYNDVHYSMPQIELDDNLLNKMCKQYEQIDWYVKSNQIRLYVDQIGLTKITQHPTTIFMSRLILMYLYNKWYRRLVNRVKSTINVTLNKPAIMLLLYDRMTELCATLDAIPELTLALKKLRNMCENC